MVATRVVFEKEKTSNILGTPSTPYTHGRRTS